MTTGLRSIPAGRRVPDTHGDTVTPRPYWQGRASRPEHDTSAPVLTGRWARDVLSRHRKSYADLSRVTGDSEHLLRQALSTDLPLPPYMATTVHMAELSWEDDYQAWRRAPLTLRVWWWVVGLITNGPRRPYGGWVS